jgi:hypothetical protein
MNFKGNMALLSLGLLLLACQSPKATNHDAVQDSFTAQFSLQKTISTQEIKFFEWAAGLSYA